ncbi:MAG: gliding motility-associated C-terminal domain-containing protein [Bacteroidetes bacterium]|nr:MAG: gliding motility-associated C-terminal domain-containing protein [Bacteroidota bacterium]
MERILTVILLILKTSLWLQAQPCNSQSINMLQVSRDFGYGIPNIQDPPGYSAPAPYLYNAGIPAGPGTYTIANNTGNWGGVAADWITTGDNSITPIGYMMVINSAPAPGIFWSELLPLCADGNYIFSFDAINLYEPGLPAQPLPSFDFYVNGLPVTSFGLLPADGQWHNFNVTFTINTVADIPFELFNNTLGGTGNVFAIDNLTLIRCGPELSLTELNPRFHCPGDSIEMTVTLGPNDYPDPWFQWQLSTDGGQNWGNYGNPTNNPNFTFYNLPIAARVRLAAAPTQAELNNVMCVTYSGPFPIAFLPPELCSNAITTIGALCNGNQGPNGFPNGDFGSGPDNVLPFDPGYAPGYIYEFNPPPDDGTYTITNNTTNWGSFAAGSWINIYDNSPDTTGYMMVVNASPEPGLFYEQTIPVCENTLYEFSCDVISMNWPIFIGTLAEPNISFVIDGVEVFATGNIPIDSTWRTFGFTVTTAPGITQLTLGLRNNTPGGQSNAGNDLAIDNISFRACGPAVAIQEVTTPPYCTGSTATLLADIGPGFDSPEWQWQFSTDGGLTWQNIGGPTQQPTLDLPDLQQDILVRLLVAETTGNLTEENCRLLSDTFSLTVFPTAETTLTATICQGQTYPFGNQTLTSAGIYQQLLSTQNGCDSLVILELDVGTLETTENTSICQGQTFSFGTQTLSAPGTYQETFSTPDGCDSTVTLILEVYQITEMANATICQGQTYPFGTQTLSDPGTYQETFSTPGGCDSTVTLSLEVYQITEMANATICQGQTYPFGTQTLSDPGTYQETFSTPNGCDSTVTLSLTVEDLSGFDLLGDTVLCAGETGILTTVQPFATYNWSTGVQTPVAEVALPGWYTVTVSSSLGCTASNSIYVEQSLLSWDIQPTGPLCFGDRNGRIAVGQLQGMGPFRFALNNGPLQSDSVFTGLAPGIYMLTIQDALGCSEEVTIGLQEPAALAVDAGPDQTLDLGDTTLLNATTNLPVTMWQWAPPDGLSCTDCPDPVATPPATTTYSVQVTNANGCTAEAVVTLQVNTEQRVYIPNVFSPNLDGTNDYFTIITGDGVALIRQMEIFDRWGNHIFSAPADQPPGALTLQWDGRYKGNNLPPAVFTWMVEVVFTDGSSKVYKGDVTLVR